MFKKKQPAPQTARQRQPVQPGSAPRSGSLVFSYHAMRPATPVAGQKGSSKQQQAGATPVSVRRASSINWGKKRAILAGIILLAAVLFNLVLSTSPTVETTGAQTGQIFLRAPAVYAQAAHNIAASSILNRNKVTINTTSIAKRMQAQFPELANVSVSLPFLGGRPIVYIQPSTPRLLLAANSGASGTYVVDDNGRALIMSNQVPHIGELSLPVVTDQSGLTVQLGHLALPSSNVAFITEVVGQLQAKGVHFTSLTLPAGTSELDVRLSGAPYVAKFNLRGDARAEAGSYLAVAAQLAKEKRTPAEYIDVRVDQRAYYK